MRYRCERCPTTMEDIEELRFSIFGKCSQCREYAMKCWQFAMYLKPDDQEIKR